MEDENTTMILAMNPAVGHERPGLFSKFFATKHDEKVIHTPKTSSQASSTCSSQTKDDRKSVNGRPSSTKRRAASPKQQERPEQIGRGLVEMAEAQANLCHWEKAFELWDQAVELQKKKLGSRHPTVAFTLTRRGNASAHLGHWYPAVLDLEKAAHIYQSTSDDRLASDTLIQLASAQERIGHFDEAVSNMKAALSLKDKLQDEEGAALLNCLIGNIHHQQRNYEEAIESYRRGLERYEQAGVDKNHPDVVWATRRATCRSMQGHLFWSAGEKTME